jgi:hypothetical protein
VTVCIAAICDQINEEGYYPKIVFCADRLVSAGVQYESRESKIKELTKYCYAMHSSTDARISDLILERVKARITNKENFAMKIKEIVDILCEECVKFKKEQADKEILFKYNWAIESLKANPDTVIKDAISEIQDYRYPNYGLMCDFIVFGLELPKEAHIYKIDQDGKFLCCDAIGFETAGSGGSLAFLEMTRYPASREMGMVMAIPKVYMAKKVSERAEGVGRYTELYILYLIEDPNTKKIIPYVLNLFTKDIIEKLDRVISSVHEYEITELDKLSKEIYEMFTRKPKGES